MMDTMRRAARAVTPEGGRVPRVAVTYYGEPVMEVQDYQPPSAVADNTGAVARVVLPGRDVYVEMSQVTVQALGT